MFSHTEIPATTPEVEMTTVKVVLIGDSDAKKEFIKQLPSVQSTSLYKGTLGIDFGHSQIGSVCYQIADLSSAPRFAHMYPHYLQNANTVIFIDANKNLKELVAGIIDEKFSLSNIHLTEFTQNQDAAQFLQDAVKRNTPPAYVTTTTVSELTATEMAANDARGTFNSVCNKQFFSL